MVDANKMAEIRKTDSTPIIKAFTVAHEGGSDVLLNGILTPIHWVQKAVEWIKDALSIGTKVFHLHGPAGDNSHAGRIPIGEVIGTKLTQVKDKVATIAAMYIYPDARDIDVDVASIETDIEYMQNNNMLYPTRVAPITGVALGSSKKGVTPGFPEATILGAIQAFANSIKEKPMTFEEIRQAVYDMGIDAEKLYGVDTLISLPGIKTKLDAEKTDVYSHAKRAEREAAKLRDELNNMKLENFTYRRHKLFDSIAEQRKLGEQEKKYLDMQLKHFNSEATDDVTFVDDLNKYVDAELTNFITMKELLGVGKDGGKDGGDDEGGDSDNGSAPANRPEQKAYIPVDPQSAAPYAELAKPENNPWIP